MNRPSVLLKVSISSYNDDEFECFKKRLLVDSRGHAFNFRPSDPTLFLRVKNIELVRALSNLKSGEKLENNTVAVGSSCLWGRCFTCNEEPEFLTDGVNFYPEAACEYPDGILLEFELNIPSGVMVVANDLRDYFNIAGEYDINTRIGCVKTSLAMAKIGCAYAFVGNSCPSVYESRPGRYFIAVTGLDESYEPVSPPKSWKEVAHIDTSLWWYSIVDGDEYQERGCDEGKYSDVTKVRVRPGVYRFTHYMHTNRPEPKRGETEIFTKIKWVRPPDPKVDYLAEYRQRNFTAEQVVADLMKQWPTLFRGEDGIWKVVDHIFCVNGGGGFWHPNGFYQSNPDMDGSVPLVEIPEFEKKYRWYPLSEYSAIYRVAHGEIKLNHSFVRLARNILECMIKHGSESHYEDKIDRNLAIAVECLESLNKRYPLA